MFPDTNLFIYPLVSTLLILITMLVFIAKAKRTPLLYSVLILQLTLLLWTLGQTIQMFSSGNGVTWFSLILIYLGICFLPLSWLVFCALFTGHKQILELKFMVPFMILPLTSFLMFITNPYHHKFLTNWNYEPALATKISYAFGPLFWFTTYFSYIYMIIGIGALVIYFLKHQGIARKQSLILIFSPLSSFIFSIARNINQLVQHIESPVYLDFTPTFFSITMILFLIAAFRYRFLNVYQGAIKKVFRNMNESVVLIDYYNCIFSSNAAFEQNFGEYKNEPNVTTFTNDLRRMAEPGERTEFILKAIEGGDTDLTENDEITVLLPQRKTFTVTIQRLFDRKRKYHTRIVSFTDVSSYKELLEELNWKNAELASANRQLEAHLQTVEELAIANERNRIAREVHDTTGHTLTLLIMLVKAGLIELEVNSTRSKEKFRQVETIAQEGLQDLRHSVSSLMARKLEPGDIAAGIAALIQDCQSAGVKIDFSVLGLETGLKGMPSDRLFRVADTLFKICKEAITNSLRHGKATQINVILKYYHGKIKLYIVDNGQGCKDLTKGFGLSGMEERIRALNGSINYGSDGEKGFNIRVEVPIGGFSHAEGVNH